MIKTFVLASIFTAILKFFTPTHTASTCVSDGSAASVQSCHDAAQNGDTITMPAGKFVWTQKVTITKPITLMGQGGANDDGTANDSTVIVYNLPTQQELFALG